MSCTVHDLRCKCTLAFTSDNCFVTFGPQLLYFVKFTPKIRHLFIIKNVHREHNNPSLTDQNVHPLPLASSFPPPSSIPSPSSSTPCLCPPLPIPPPSSLTRS